ncbi:MAG: DUF5723 family protein [Flavobacteriaceae bacterium]
MIRKVILFCLCVAFFHTLDAQNNNILFGFSESPQKLLVNPGAETNYKYHAGIPLFSGISLNSGSSKLVLSDLFLSGGNFTNKVSNTINKLSSEDYISFNSQIEVLNLGYRLDDATYISGGFYTEIDFIGYFPKDVAILLNEGNSAYLNKNFSLAQLTMRFDVLGVLHAGITRKMSERLTLGGRIKIYSSSLNANTNNNSGTFTTSNGTNNILRHSLRNIDFEFNSSGIYDGEHVSVDGGSVATNTLLGGNLGFGLDLGFTYHVSPQLEISGSILDLGYISYSKQIKTKTLKGSYDFEGIEFQFDGNNPTYWEDLTNDFNNKLPRVDNSKPYSLMRPTKIYGALKYSYGESRSISGTCYNTYNKEYFSNSIGLQIFSILRPQRTHFALTTFYEKALGENFRTKLTYTVDDFSYTNVGLGMSTLIGKVNTYVLVDNVFGLDHIGYSKRASIQLGMNLIFK